MTVISAWYVRRLTGASIAVQLRNPIRGVIAGGVMALAVLAMRHITVGTTNIALVATILTCIAISGLCYAATLLPTWRWIGQPRELKAIVVGLAGRLT